MGKIWLAAFLSLLLVGCSQEDPAMQRGLELRSRLLKGEGCSFQAAITADYGDKLFEFALACEGEEDGDIQFTVTAPELITGITGEMDQEEGRLTFDGAALQFDKMAEDQISPVSGPWVFLSALRSGYITSAAAEGEGIHLTLDDRYEEDALQVDLWLDSSDLPVRCEILYKGRRIVSMDIGNFQIR